MPRGIGRTKENDLDCSNYLQIDCKDKYNVIITNPPFNISLDIIKKALDDVKDSIISTLATQYVTNNKDATILIIGSIIFFFFNSTKCPKALLNIINVFLINRIKRFNAIMKIIPLLKRYDFPIHKVMKGLAKIKRICLL